MTGEVRLKLYKGNITVDGRESPRSLYDEGIASMEGGGSYNQTDAEGFMRIESLPARVEVVILEATEPLHEMEQHDAGGLVPPAVAVDGKEH